MDKQLSTSNEKIGHRDQKKILNTNQLIFLIFWILIYISESHLLPQAEILVEPTMQVGQSC